MSLTQLTRLARLPLHVGYARAWSLSVVLVCCLAAEQALAQPTPATAGDLLFAPPAPLPVAQPPVAQPPVSQPPVAQPFAPAVIVAPPPAAPVIAVPPPAAAPPPALTPGLVDRAAGLQFRIATLTAKERDLVLADRESHPLKLPFAVMVGGFAAAASIVGFLILWTDGSTSSGPSQGPQDPSKSTITGLAATALAAGAVGAGGLIALLVRRHQRPHRGEIKQLRVERVQLMRELKQVQRAQYQAGLTLAPRTSIAKGELGFCVRYAF